MEYSIKALESLKCLNPEPSNLLQKIGILLHMNN